MTPSVSSAESGSIVARSATMLLGGSRSAHENGPSQVLVIAQHERKLLSPIGVRQLRSLPRQCCELLDALHLPAKLFLKKLRVTTDLRIASATVDARCSGGDSEY